LRSPATPRPAAIRPLPTETGRKPFSTATLGAIGRVRRHIYIENPHLFDKRVIVALVRVLNRGVDVRVILPRVNDFKTGGRSNLVLANDFLEHAVRVHSCPGMTHVTALLVDDWVCLGSGNLIHFSLRLCHEPNLATSDPASRSGLKRDLFEADSACSCDLTKPITLGWSDFLADLMLEGF
jgi:phosphatidylserine/phosphatidylglycerophosphate/cardiolipin synthase-like enzyme